MSQLITVLGRMTSPTSLSAEGRILNVFCEKPRLNQLGWFLIKKQQNGQNIILKTLFK